MNSLISIEKLNKSYDGKSEVLHGLNFSIQPGKIATIYGSSGCGKSTFLNIVGLLEDFSDGEYYFKGNKINSKRLNSYNTLRAQEIGFVFQSYHLIDSLSVQENILMPFLYNNLPLNSNVYSSITQLLNQFQMEQFQHKKVSLLSGGERQRVAIIRAMIKSPSLIIADEPTGNLDDINTSIVIRALQSAADQGTAVIVVTHNKQLSFNNADIYTLTNGALQR